MPSASWLKRDRTTIRGAPLAQGMVLEYPRHSPSKLAQVSGASWQANIGQCIVARRRVASVRLCPPRTMSTKSTRFMNPMTATCPGSRSFIHSLSKTATLQHSARARICREDPTMSFIIRWGLRRSRRRWCDQWIGFQLACGGSAEMAHTNINWIELGRGHAGLCCDLVRNLGTQQHMRENPSRRRQGFREHSPWSCRL